MLRSMVWYALALLLLGVVLASCRKGDDSGAEAAANTASQAARAARSGLAAPGDSTAAAGEPAVKDIPAPEAGGAEDVEPTRPDPAQELSDIMAGGPGGPPAKAPPATKGPQPPRQGPSNTGEALAVRGTVLIASRVPEPGSVPYTDCVTFLKYRVDEVLVGDYGEKEILVVFWGMRDNKLEPAAGYEEGDQHELKLVPFADMKDLAQVMQADDTADYSLEPYFALSCEGVR